MNQECKHQHGTEEQTPNPMNWELTGQYKSRAYLRSEEHRGNGGGTPCLYGRAAGGGKHRCGPAGRRSACAFAGSGSRLGPQEGEAVRCIFFGAWRARAAETEEGGAGETRARVGRPSPPAGRGSGEASDVSTREWNEALPGALRSLRFQGV